ncbi:unnamed protein product [Aphanomyces euteiches]|uniref:WW domain-containing protein n=1 Tax=Aphanomyces euteiches TaxID=100861 RepID=A0A6G0XC39_9STRA|nr:hypothetical protein Ae201684_006738 [Aphanomyces euteiches]KAH9090919.1 hypothetical protein Ae201684P_006323 [Aphanomyces euteiches]
MSTPTAVRKKKRKKNAQALSSPTPSREDILGFVSTVACQTSPNASQVQATRPSAVNDILSVLRNPSDSMHERAVAARALGLLMENDEALILRLKMESDTIVDSLLTIINHCRHNKQPTATLESRKMHVNCCLVVSMLMDSPAYAVGSVVQLNTELLNLTLTPRPQVCWSEPSRQAVPPPLPPPPSRNQREDEANPPSASRSTLVTRMSRKRSLPSGNAAVPNDIVLSPAPAKRSLRAGPRPVSMKSTLFGDEGRIMGLTPTGENLPLYEFDAAFSGYGVPQVFYPFHRPNTIASAAPVPSYATRDRMRPTTITKPSRAVKESHATHTLATTPNIIFPSKLYRQALESSDRPRPFVMPPDYMLNMLHTNDMPLSLPFSRRNNSRRTDSTESRIQPTPWGEVNRVVLVSGLAKYIPLESTPVQTPPMEPEDDEDGDLDINSAAYKRKRLLAILHAPVESTTHEPMRALAVKENATVMRGFSHTLKQLHNEQQALMDDLGAAILRERNRLPLKFLFELPGGIGYCRDRMQTSMRLWMEEFEMNQQRAAWLQWKALVEQFRYKDRMGEFVRQAALKRLRLAMVKMIRAFLHKGWIKWVLTIQIDIWKARDAAASRIQPQVRRFFALKRFLALHDEAPVNGKLSDMFLAAPRPHLPFAIPLRVRMERRKLWFAAIAVQAPYRGRRFRKFMRRQRLAATKIQAETRRRQARWRYFAARRKIIRLQAHIRRRQAQQAYRRLKNAALVVQRNLRGRAARKFVRVAILATRRATELKWQAVATILRFARGFLARRAAQAIRDHHARRLRAAVLIQKAWYTYNNEWTTFLLLGCLREREVDDKAWENDLHVYHRHRNARVIQAAYRAFVSQQRESMAWRIQLCARAFLARRRVERKRRQILAHRRIKWWFRVHHRRRHRFATRIQFWWRKAVPGRLLRHLAAVAATIRAAQERLQKKIDYNATTMIQAVVHGVWTRFFVKKTKCAIVIQRNMRRHWAQQEAQRRRLARRLQVATAFLGKVYREVAFRVLDRRSKLRRACATCIQRVFRGQWTRQHLAEQWLYHDERTRMAQRVQRLWRQSAEKRFAKRILALQRRRLANPFNHVGALSTILTTSVDKSRELFDPYDPLAGLQLIGWLRRLGLDDFYDMLVKLGYSTVASLAPITDEFLLKTCQIKDKDARQLFLTGIHYRAWLVDVTAQRQRVQALERAYRRADNQLKKDAKEVVDHEAVAKRWQHKLDKANADASDFQHPPKAVRTKQERATHRLSVAASALARCIHARDISQAAATAAKQQWTQAKETLKTMETNEVKAVFLLKAATFVDSTERIKELFLDHFPSMESRAERFVESVDCKSVTLCQFVRFFSQHTTISDVKLHTNDLLVSKYDAEIAAHDHKRLAACADLLQFAIERIGALIDVPIVSMADRRATSPISMVQAILKGLQHARQAPLPQRPRILRECLAELAKMHASAAMMQRLWRTRVARQLVACLRNDKRRRELSEAYAAERRRQNVRAVWEADVKKAHTMLEARAKEMAHAALLEELGMTLRFGYSQEWHDEHEMWFYVELDSGAMVWERPSYNEDEWKASKRIARSVRRFLGKCRRAAIQRSLARWTKYEQEKMAWEALWMDRRRFVTLRLQAFATAKPDAAAWRLGRHEKSTATTEALEAWAILLAQVYHKSVRKAHAAHLLVPVYARPPNAHAAALIDLLRFYGELVEALRPSRGTALSMRYTKVEMPFGWTEIPADKVYYYHMPTGAVTWDVPEYTFEDEYAARKLQSAYRMLQGRKAFQRMLRAFSFVDLIHASIKMGAAIGWIGFGLEGMPLAVYLTRLGLGKQLAAVAKANVTTIDAFWAVPDDKWLSLGVLWTKEEKTLCQSAPRSVRPSKRRAPLTSRMDNLPEKHGFHVLPSEKVVQKILVAHFTGQQSRVLGLVRAITAVAFPVSFKQLEMYIRSYGGRPSQAADNIAEIVPPGSTTEADEVALYKLFRHALRRCAIVASNLKLTSLALKLKRILQVAASIHGVACDRKLAISATPLAADDVAWVLKDLPPVKGLWESDVRATAKLSVAQAALWLRHVGLEYMLRVVRSALAIQATFRMSVVRKWYVAVVAHRHASALTIQLAWRCSMAYALRMHYLAEQRSEYEQHYIESSALFFYVYVPTQERLQSPPVDAFGDELPFRPQVIDRLTRKWILAWPWLASSNQAPDTAASAFESNVVCSVCDNERASRVCDVCCTSRGDYIYYCFACYTTAHPPALSWHTYKPLNRVVAQALRCVECTRLSAHRCLVCHEDYCDRCLSRIHGKGRRSTHLIEHYAPESQVCIECEMRVALQTCAVCGDALCEACAARTHAKGNKAKHAMMPIEQPLPPDSSHCAQCRARVADSTCHHCAKPVCKVCADTTHLANCLETQLDVAKRKLLGNNVCVDCGKPADRECATCGDKYCSIRWMGNPGCFERFHAKGKRIEHEATPLTLPPLELTPEVAALERKVMMQRQAARAAEKASMQAQQDAEERQRLELEREQRAFAAQIQRAKRELHVVEEDPMKPSTEEEKLPPPLSIFRKPKKQAPKCTVAGCTDAAIRRYPYCATHCTAQKLLAMGYDTKEAAKVLASIEKAARRRKDFKNGQHQGLPLLTRVRRELQAMPFLNGGD